mmetsp:Transcript_2133/g.4961  ORF Transcript_2133/g.4961 Transcript_2133/m.4961 type:complete len:495 (+) Transcript_2133:505-1989(+)|eukprot:CAMPEP_0178991362 /NCGR_PEP_ID=MMETSP0795-20121207/5480_1 /TAXON_ID=88552 /ORGANISM="Amoebophrya sp., Strain Ameob2" /LENGTH=494 /DNA_ID=CAMNT_0020683051 /DNA_START=474 /DNA_END=1958 /DNA_ORIENTATION=-
MAEGSESDRVIGVLGLQGAFQEHADCLRRCFAAFGPFEVRLVKTAGDLWKNSARTSTSPSPQTVSPSPCIPDDDDAEKEKTTSASLSPPPSIPEAMTRPSPEAMARPSSLTDDAEKDAHYARMLARRPELFEKLLSPSTRALRQAALAQPGNYKRPAASESSQGAHKKRFRGEEEGNWGKFRGQGPREGDGEKILLDGKKLREGEDGECLKVVQKKSDEKFLRKNESDECLKKKSYIDGLILPGGESTSMSILLAGGRAGGSPSTPSSSSSREGHGDEDEDEGELLEALAGYIRSKKPMFGTCAGCILLAEEVVATPQQPEEREQFAKPLGALPIRVQRNFFGRQIDSFSVRFGGAETQTHPCFRGEEAIFIRAPVILGPSSRSRSRSTWGQDIDIDMDDSEPRLEVLATICVGEGSSASCGNTNMEWHVMNGIVNENGNPKPKPRRFCVAARKGRVMGTCFHPELVSSTEGKVPYAHEYFLQHLVGWHRREEI